MQNITPKLVLMYFNATVLFLILFAAIIGILSHAFNIFQAEKLGIRIIEGGKTMYIDDSDANCPPKFRRRIIFMRRVFFISIISLSLVLMAGISLQKALYGSLSDH